MSPVVSDPAFTEHEESRLVSFDAQWNAANSSPLGRFINEQDSIPFILELIRIDLCHRSRMGMKADLALYQNMLPKVVHGDELLNPLKQMLEHYEQMPFQLETSYASLIFHAQGGLGQVFQAQDLFLNRRVAVKTLLPQWCGSEHAREDFLCEARVTSQLEHPGIVPIYQVGQLADKRPCYSMRFIEGQTLQQAIKEYHQGQSSQTSEKRLAFRHLLSRFVAVCQTVAYVHSKGVLHRDLKPENIMLGKFGETIVLDWGMSPRQQKTSRGATDWNANRNLSHYSGSIQGTLGYLSPEQASGGSAEITSETDIFGLGATLYAILCNRPPYQQITKESAFEQALLAKFDPPSSIVGGVPRALEAICLKAMSREPGDRYASASALASDVDRFLADEPVTAWKEPWVVTFKRFLRHHHSLVAVLVALGIVIPLATAIGSWLLAKEHTKSQLSEQQARLKEVSAQQLTDYLTRIFETASPFAGASSGFRGDEEQTNLQTAQLFLERGNVLVQEHLKDQPLIKARLLEAMSRTYQALGLYTEALNLAKESRELHVKHLGATHQSTYSSELLLGCIAQDLGNYQEADQYFRKVLKARQDALGENSLQVAEAAYWLGSLSFYRPLSVEGPQFQDKLRKEAEQLLLKALKIRRELLPKNHEDIGFTLAALASLKLSEPGQERIALQYASEAMTVFQQSKQAGPIGNILVKMVYAEKLRSEGKFQDAEASYQEILTLMKKYLGARHPLTILQMGNLVGLVNKSGDISRALRLARELMDIIRHNPNLRSQPMIVQQMIYYADVAKMLGNLALAQQGYQEAWKFASERPLGNEKNLQELKGRFRDNQMKLPDEK
ncbi:MAG: serine/threonine protein kinase [Planctomycetia bacterium]|nr:serine/threonine protein kinase [Planctomycetia bacterium]